MSKILVITTSLRAKSNSDLLAARLIAGAKDAGNEVEAISLKGKKINYCIGCLACQTCSLEGHQPAEILQMVVGLGDAL